MRRIKTVKFDLKLTHIIKHVSCHINVKVLDAVAAEIVHFEYHSQHFQLLC